VKVTAAPVSNGVSSILVAYNGSALPAMNNGNAVPAGVTFCNQPWQVESGAIQDGFMLATPMTNPGAFTSLFFVPNFLINPGSTTGNLTTSAAQAWGLNFLKALNPNQGPFTVTATLTGLGVGSTPINVVANMVYNGYGQAVGISIPLTAAQVGNGYAGTSTTGTIHLTETQPLHYLSGSTFVRNSALSLLNQSFTLTAPQVTDTTPPSIYGASLLPNASGGSFNSGWTNNGETMDTVGGTVAVTVTAQDSTCGLDHLELWVMTPTTHLDAPSATLGLVPPPYGPVATYKFTGTPQNAQTVTLSFANTFNMGTPGKVWHGVIGTLFVKAINAVGLVTGEYVLPAVGPGVDTRFYNPPSSGTVVINWTATTAPTTTNVVNGNGSGESLSYQTQQTRDLALTWTGTLVGPNGYSLPVNFTGTTVNGVFTQSLTVPNLAFGTYLLNIGSGSGQSVSQSLITIDQWNNPVGIMGAATAYAPPAETLPVSGSMTVNWSGTVGSTSTATWTGTLTGPNGYSKAVAFSQSVTPGAYGLLNQIVLTGLAFGAYTLTMTSPATTALPSTRSGYDQIEAFNSRGVTVATATISATGVVNGAVSCQTVYGTKIDVGYYKPAYDPDHQCVPAGTPVLLVDGTTVPIETLQEGMQVAALDEHTLEPMVATVTNMIITDDQPLILVKTAAGDLFCTPSHRVFRAEDRTWVNAELLAPGDTTLWVPKGCLTPTWVPVLSVEPTDRVETIYHMSVDQGHVFIAGGVPAHNKDK
jgi:hypothetical protein